MKEIKTIKSGKNYSAITVGKMDELNEHVLQMGEGMVTHGKVFVGDALGATGAQMSFQSMPVGADSPFVHAHKTHEELYIIVKGEGEYQVDGEIFPIAEGSVVRVAPDGKRALRNTGKEPLVMICVQYKANSFGKDDDAMTDGIILQEPLKW
jgi:mannose-6-phosphate isomerase-like protein (cupin superfamily)